MHDYEIESGFHSVAFCINSFIKKFLDCDIYLTNPGTLWSLIEQRK